jgi:hypothetical protein
MNKLNFAYTAGYLDGDGCFYLGKTIQKPKNIVVYEYHIAVVSVKRESLEFFVKNFGGNISTKPQRARHKLPYCWTIKTLKSIDVAKAVRNFLIDKKIACELYIKMGDLIKQNGLPPTQQTINSRENIIKLIRKDRHMNDFVTKEKVDSLKNCVTIKPTEEDYAYLAGLIDAEGCFRIKRSKPKNKPNPVYNITLEIGNTKFPIFPFLVERFGGTVSFTQPKREKSKPVANWSIHALTLSKVIPTILPWLICKKDAAQKVMEFYDTNLSNGGDRHSKKFKRLYAETLIKRERLIFELHNLNLKGLKL